MSDVIDIVEDAISKVSDIVKSVWDVVRNIGEFLVTFDFDSLEEAIRILFRDVISPILQPVFALLGIEDETLYSIEVVTIPLIDKEAVYFKTNLVQAILEGTSISEEIKFSLLTGQRSAVRSFLNYGQNNYIDGVPTAEVSEYFIDAVLVLETLEAELGETVTPTSIEFAEPNHDLWVQKYLMTNNSYSIETNNLVMGTSNWFYSSTTLNGAGTDFIINIYRDIETTTIVDDYTQVLLVATVEYTDTWTRTTTEIDNGTPAEFSTSFVDTNYVRTATSTGGPFQTTFVNVSTTVVDTVENDVLDTEAPIYATGGYYYVVYELDSAPGIKEIWFYSSASGVYPELDNSLIGGNTDRVDTLPIVALREEFTTISADSNLEEYTSTKNIINRLNLMDLDSLLTDIDANPDIDLVQDAFFLFGANLYTEDQSSLKYLFNFFIGLSVLPKYNKTDFNALSAADKSSSNFIYKISEGRFNLALSGNYIELTEITGNIGSIGYVETQFTIVANTVAVEDLSVRRFPAERDTNNSLGLINSTFTIRKQTESNKYLEIEANGLLLTTYVLTQGTSVGVKAIELVDPTTGSDADKANFIIPLSYYLLSRQNFIECEQVIYDAAHLVFYAEQSTDLEYYETSSFISLITVIIEIAAIISLITSAGSATSVSLALKSIAKNLIIQYGLTLALEEILSSNLSDAEKAVLLVVYTFANQSASTFFDLEAPVSLADKLLLSVNSVNTFLQIDTSIKQEELLQETQELEQQIFEKQEQIELAQEFLNTDGTINTLDLLNSRIVPTFDLTSTPQEFYAKSLTVSVAPIVLSQPSTYVTTVLDLNNIRTGLNTGSIDYNIDNELKLI